MERIFEEIEALEWEDRPMFDVSSRCLEPLSYIYEEEDKVRVLIDLPFVNRKEDITVRVEKNIIEVEARMSREVKYSSIAGLYKDITFNTFRKIIRFPFEIDPDSVKAKFKNGVLELLIKRGKRRTRIPVE